MSTQAHPHHAVPYRFLAWPASSEAREDRILRPIAATLLALLAAFWAAAALHAATAPLPSESTEVVAFISP